MTRVPSSLWSAQHLALGRTQSGVSVYTCSMEDWHEGLAEGLAWREHVNFYVFVGVTF